MRAALVGLAASLFASAALAQSLGPVPGAPAGTDVGNVEAQSLVNTVAAHTSAISALQIKLPLVCTSYRTAGAISGTWRVGDTYAWIERKGAGAGGSGAGGTGVIGLGRAEWWSRDCWRQLHFQQRLYCARHSWWRPTGSSTYWRERRNWRAGRGRKRNGPIHPGRQRSWSAGRRYGQHLLQLPRHGCRRRCARWEGCR